ncbi:Hypothetical protein CAP_3354 [Chondromyces apiculatus DSM 436]|uniref:Uncharacterized protein n=1 Tax=Chondromyces apiculatus DSM 436 TaxID=1192034 RepID=A0A017T908_9BACT|nr:Hypothetical protein CAP_3354 [Chondromyces apiculatus DSM 436]
MLGLHYQAHPAAREDALDPVPPRDPLTRSRHPLGRGAGSGLLTRRVSDRVPVPRGHPLWAERLPAAERRSAAEWRSAAERLPAAEWLPAGRPLQPQRRTCSALLDRRCFRPRRCASRSRFSRRAHPGRDALWILLDRRCVCVSGARARTGGHGRAWIHGHGCLTSRRFQGQDSVCALLVEIRIRRLESSRGRHPPARAWYRPRAEPRSRPTVHGLPSRLPYACLLHTWFTQTPLLQSLWKTQCSPS